MDTLKSLFQLSLAKARLEAALAASQEDYDALAKVVTAEVDEDLTYMIKLVAYYDEMWQWVCRHVLKGYGDLIQEGRDEQLASLEGFRTSLHRYKAKVHALRLPVTGLERFDAEVAKFDQRASRINSRWKTVEDLEELAAENVESAPQKAAAVRAEWMRLIGLPEDEIAESCRPDSEQPISLVAEVRELKAALRLKDAGPTYGEMLSWSQASAK